ncbi:MAG: hypothetical protein A2Z83_06205 [Omnitrophica bacterium GWA2_52_8]|nr:MAG: hypothetical protein A2Z83_06205 [Omnitrophica bacterium GWA2_52_8]
MIIGLTGKNGSGKGQVAERLKDCGFLYVSLSDVLREEAVRRKLALTRENLYALGNRLRSEHGAGYLAGQVLAKIDPGKPHVIDSIRHPEEVVRLRKASGFVFVAVEASPEIRFARMLERAREKDPKTWEEFRRLESREAESGNEADQQLDKTLKLADYTVQNGGSLQQLEDNIRNLLKKIQK